MAAPRMNASGIRRPAMGIDINVERLIRLRQEKSWKRADLAEASKISRSMIAKIETRERRPATAVLAAICAALGCDVADLLPEQPERKEPP